MKRSLLALVLLLLLPIANAQTFSDYIAVADLEKNRVDITLSISATQDVESIKIPLFAEPAGFSIYDKKTLQIVGGKILKEGESFFLVIDRSLSAGQNADLSVTLFYTDLAKQSEGGKIFTITYKIPNGTERFELIVKLPEGYIVSESTTSASIYPEPTNLLSDGRKILVDWVEDKPRGEFFAFINFEESAQKQNVLLPVAAVALLFVLILLVLFNRSKKKEEKIVKKIAPTGLGQDEKKIYSLVQEKGEISQKELQQILQFSKPRLSKLVRSLAEKNLVEIMPQGRINIIKIKKLDIT